MVRISDMHWRCRWIVPASKSLNAKTPRWTVSPSGTSQGISFLHSKYARSVRLWLRLPVWRSVAFVVATGFEPRSPQPCRG